MNRADDIDSDVMRAGAARAKLTLTDHELADRVGWFTQVRWVIGVGAKVAAGSVVLKDVPPHCTVAGVPARVIGRPHADKPALEMDQSLPNGEQEI